MPICRYKPWNSKERKQLLALVESFGTNWEKIANRMGDRTPQQMKSFYYHEQRREKVQVMERLKSIVGDSLNK